MRAKDGRNFNQEFVALSNDNSYITEMIVSSMSTSIKLLQRVANIDIIQHHGETTKP